jgi:hypothetical protein
MNRSRAIISGGGQSMTQPASRTMIGSQRSHVARRMPSSDRRFRA